MVIAQTQSYTRERSSQNYPDGIDLFSHNKTNIYLRSTTRKQISLSGKCTNKTNNKNRSWVPWYFIGAKGKLETPFEIGQAWPSENWIYQRANRQGGSNEDISKLILERSRTSFEASEGMIFEARSGKNLIAKCSDTICQDFK